MSTLAASCSAFAGVRVACAPSAPRCSAAGPLLVECAHKKGAGSVKNSQDSESKRLGVKIYGDQPAFSGNIILRQRGTVWTAGPGTMMGKDHTIFAVEDGLVKFEKSAVRSRICITALPDSQPEDLGPVVETRRTRKYAKYPPRGELSEELISAMADAVASVSR